MHDMLLLVEPAFSPDSCPDPYSTVALIRIIKKATDMVTTTVLASTGSLFLRLSSAAAASAASGQFSAALAGSARHFSSSAPGSELKAHLAAQIPAQQVGPWLWALSSSSSAVQESKCSPTQLILKPAGTAEELEEAVWQRCPGRGHCGHGHWGHARHPGKLQL